MKDSHFCLIMEGNNKHRLRLLWWFARDAEEDSRDANRIIAYPRNMFVLCNFCTVQYGARYHEARWRRASYSSYSSWSDVLPSRDNFVHLPVVIVVPAGTILYHVVHRTFSWQLNNVPVSCFASVLGRRGVDESKRRCGDRKRSTRYLTAAANLCVTV